MDAFSTYAAQATATASPAQLVLMLYDGAVARIQRAEQALADIPEPQVAHDALTRAQAIVAELSASLDHQAGGALAGNLGMLYDYVQGLLLDANVTKRPDRLPEVVGVLRDLRDAWEAACCKGSVPIAVGG